MNFKTTYILFGVLFGMLGLFLITQLFGTKPPDQPYVLPSLHDVKEPVRNEDIDRVEIARFRPTEERLMFYKDEQGNWRLKEPSVRVDSSPINRVIDQVMMAHRDESADVNADLQRFGLDSPSTTVTLFKKGTDREWKINLGDVSSGGESADIYVTSSDFPKQPMAVRRSDLDALTKSIKDFRSKTLLADTAFDVTAVKLEEPKKETVALEKTSDNRWRFDKPAYGQADYEGETPGTPAASQGIKSVRDLVQAVADLRVESEDDFGPTDDKDADLADKGLEKGKETLRIETRRQPSSLASQEKKEPVTDALLIGKKADDKGDKLYARLESERNVVKVPAKKVEPLLKFLQNPAVVRNRDLVLTDSARIDAVNVKLHDADVVHLRKSGEPPVWKLYESAKAEETDAAAVQNLLTALTTKRQVSDFPEAAKSDAELGLDKPAAVVTLWTDSIKKPKKDEDKKDEAKDEAGKDEKKDESKKEEPKDPNADPLPKDAKPAVTLFFGKKDKDVVYVRRQAEGETMRLAVPASILDKVSQGKLAYLDRKLPTFTTSDANKVTLTRNGVTYELEKSKDDKGTATWKFKQPKDLAGRTADPAKTNRLLNDLHNLQAERLVAEKATPSELERFGLKTPSVQAVVAVAVDKKTTDHTYLFGKETDDKSQVYAKQGERDMVFAVRKSVVDGLQGDLQDSVVFHFDLAKVKGLRITGWQDIIGNAFTLDLERKAANDWIVKAPPDFNLDAAKVESFLASLTDVRAVRFLGKSGPKPEYKLDLRDGALEIGIRLEGEKDPLTLTVGGPSGTEGLFARSNKLPDEVFVLPRGNFDQVRSKPAYFKK